MIWDERTRAELAEVLQAEFARFVNVCEIHTDAIYRWNYEEFEVGRLPKKGAGDGG